MTRAQFEAAANLQVFGSATVAGQWQNVKDSYTPDQSPVEVLFEASIVHRMRGAANAAKGIDTDANGRVAGAEAREKAFENQPASNERAALLTEIDRRYHLASGTAPDTKIAVNEPGKADLWRSIRDEMLESQRYQDPAVVKDLHGKLAGFRTQHDEFDKNTKIYSEEVWAAGHDRDAEQRRLPGNGGMPAKPPTERQRQAEQNIKAAKANAEAEIKTLSKDHPIFAEDDLPADKRLDKVALAQASETQLAGVLQAHIADRNAVVVEARGQLEGKHELIYRMDKLMPAFYAEMDIQPGSIHDQIIKDKMYDDAIAKLVGGILLAIVAIALTVVSLGAATPAIIAAGASIGAAGLSTYIAYDEYQQYSADHAVADAGFADDPSVVWLVLAIVGAGVDMGAATKAVRALAPAAKALEAGGEVIDFTKAVEALQRSKQLDEKIAAVADKAAARKSYAAAKGELSAALVLDNGKKIQSIFGREVDYLKAKGYTFMPDGTAVKVK
jgi:hypothetical protein